MKKRIILSVAIFILMLACSICDAEGIKFVPLTKASLDNPVESIYRYKIRSSKGQTIGIVGKEGYVFMAQNADEKRFRDGSFFWLIIFRNNTTKCAGDVIYEYDAASESYRLTEYCNKHGLSEIDVDQQLPYLQKLVGYIYQLSDRYPISAPGSAK